jgi:hypothetical protein
MAKDATAVTIVSISAGAAIAIGGGVLNAWLARRQAERRFAHERAMADRAELRLYLQHALSTLQGAVDYILGLSSDLDAVSGAEQELAITASPTRRPPWGPKRARRPPLAGQLSDALQIQAQAISDEIEKLREPALGLALMLGGTHPVTVSFRDLTGRAIACARAVPDALPAPEEERAKLTKSWEYLAEGQRDFLELAARFVGIKLDDPALPVAIPSG